jgi:hypothetical protein
VAELGALQEWAELAERKAEADGLVEEAQQRADAVAGEVEGEVARLEGELAELEGQLAREGQAPGGHRAWCSQAWTYSAL